jgi:hypothetical protein
VPIGLARRVLLGPAMLRPALFALLALSVPACATDGDPIGDDAFADDRPTRARLGCGEAPGSMTCALMYTLEGYGLASPEVHGVLADRVADRGTVQVDDILLKGDKAHLVLDKGRVMFKPGDAVGTVEADYRSGDGPTWLDHAVDLAHMSLMSELLTSPRTGELVNLLDATMRPMGQPMMVYVLGYRAGATRAFLRFASVDWDADPSVEGEAGIVGEHFELRAVPDAAGTGLADVCVAALDAPAAATPFAGEALTKARTASLAVLADAKVPYCP